MNIIIADAAVSLAPNNWKSKKPIKNYIKEYSRRPIIDGSIHQHLLSDIPKDKRKDRPDILHFGLLTALGYQKLIPDIEIYFSCDKGLYKVLSQTRLPRSQKRFYGILELLLSGDYDAPYIQRIGDSLDYFKDHKIYLSSKGKKINEQHLEYNNYVFGGFAYGNFDSTQIENGELVSLNDKELELWTALSRLINLKIFET